MSIRLLLTVLAGFVITLGKVEADGHTQNTDNSRIVLFCKGDCDALNLDSLRLRKLFLGLPVKARGDYLQAVINLSDPELSAFFYQSLVAMTRKSYEKKRLLYQLRYALTSPPRFDEYRLWRDHVMRHEALVSFAWEHELSGLDNISILQTLWQPPQQAEAHEH